MPDFADPLDQALRDGLRALSVPQPSPDFDTCVLAALHTPQPWWQRWWQPARPLLFSASCSLAVTLVLLHWTLAAPLSAPRLNLEPGGTHSLAATPAPSLDALLALPNLTAGSLTLGGVPVPAAPPPNRRSEPPRRALILRRPDLTV